MSVQQEIDPLSSLLSSGENPAGTETETSTSNSSAENSGSGAVPPGASVDDIVIGGFSIEDETELFTEPSAQDIKLLETALESSSSTTEGGASTSGGVGVTPTQDHPLSVAQNNASHSHTVNNERPFGHYLAQLSGMNNASVASTTFTSALNSLTTKIQNYHMPAGSVPGGSTLTPPQSQSIPRPAPSATPTTASSQTNLKAKLGEAVGDLLTGEKIIMFLTNLSNVTASHSSNSCELPREDWFCAMTFYRLILFCQRQQSPPKVPSEVFDRKGASLQWQYQSHISAPCHVVQIPLGAIDKVEKILDGYAPEHGSRTLLITGKDGNRWIKFTNPTTPDCARANEALITYAFPGRRNLGYLFAFEARRAEVLSARSQPNKKVFNAVEEFRRMRIFEDRMVMRGGAMTTVPSPWLLCQEINRNYALCGSYPSRFVVPMQADDGGAEGQRLLRKTAGFRSEGRLPALTWGCAADGASIWRSSQPKVGLQGNRSSSDERYLRHIAEMAGGPTSPSKGPAMSLAYAKMLTGGMDVDLNVKRGTLKILDLRPKSSAMGNRTTGYGYENVSNYPLCTITFCGIGNIHAVRDCYNRLSNLCLSPICNDQKWGSLVEDTGWPQMLRLILSAAWQTAFHVHFHRVPVLLHCSHGWDRTSQVSALAQLFLDPYYRTLEGFPVLVEKDFMAFGHPFHTRASHGEGSGDNSDNQNSPIFVQFLDAVYQILNQFENLFEFNARYILLISQHVYSCRFGTLLCDNEREREIDANTRQRTHCLWTYLKENATSLKLVNPYYQPKKLLMPPLPLLLRNITLWQDYFLRYGAKATLACVDRDLLEHIPCLSGEENDSEETVCHSEDIMDMHCKSDQMHAMLKKAYAEVEKWKRIADAKDKELEILRSDEEEMVEKEEVVANNLFTVV